MRRYFDEETDRRLLAAESEEEVRAIIAETPEADKLTDKIDQVMAEIRRIKGSVDEEVGSSELEQVAGGAKRQDVYLSESTGCVSTFFLSDLLYSQAGAVGDQYDLIAYALGVRYCGSNDFCRVSNEYLYHNTKYSNCQKGGKHDWSTHSKGIKCSKCNLDVPKKFFDDVNFES